MTVPSPTEDTQDRAEQRLHDIWRVIVEECGAPEWMGADWRIATRQNGPIREWRFQGELGFGGKIRYAVRGFYDDGCHYYVDAYLEDLTPERQAMIDRANERLRALR